MELFMWLVLVVILLSYFYATRKFNYWQERGVPFDKPVPYVGNASLVLFKHSLGTYLRELYEKFDYPVLGFFLFDRPQLVIKDPKIINVVLIEQFQNFCDHTVATNLRDDPVGTQVLFVLKNPTWRQIREKVSVAFTSSKIKLMFPLMVEAGGDMLKYISENLHGSIDTKDLTVRYATEVIASCAFGVKAFSFEREDTDFRFAAKNLFKFTWKRSIQMTCYFISPFLVKLFRMKFVEPNSCKLLENIFLNVLDSRRQTVTRRNDLIRILMEIQDTEDVRNQFSGDVVVAQAVQFFAAGFEPSASTASHAMYELSRHHYIQLRLRKEITKGLEKYKGITYEAVEEMKYLDMVIYGTLETLRKYPSVPFLDRRVKDDFTLPGTKMTIEKGTTIFIPTMGLHYDYNYYPEPETFDPERFTVENKATRPSCVFMAFGEGPRNCIGERFGLLCVKLALITVLTEYELVPTVDTPSRIDFDPRGFILTTVLPVKLLFKKIETET